MREILFRGKTKEGKWIKGDLRQVNELTYISTNSSRSIDEKVITLEPVLPNTIGQFTGLLDKNGKKIFEGDRCEVTYYNHIEKNTEIIQDVVFTDGGFALLKVGKITSEQIIEDDRTFVPLYYSQRPNIIEIIGNIHDKND